MEILCLALFFTLVVFVFLFIKNNIHIRDWKKVSKLQNELIGELKEETNLYKKQMVLYKELCKTNDIYIDVQKQYITELLGILKIEKP
jgi:hypothetical protein